MEFIASGWSYSCKFSIVSGEWQVEKAGTAECYVRNVGQCLENRSVRLKETPVRCLSLIHEVCALVRRFMSAIRTLKLRTARRKVWLVGQKEVWRARIINRRVSERETAVFALQGPSRHQTKCAPFAPGDNTGNHLAWLRTLTHRG